MKIKNLVSPGGGTLKGGPGIQGFFIGVTMKWFKHFSSARFDPKVRRLIDKYGIEGYGIYFAVVETIAFQLESTKPIPDIEENSNDIAVFFKMDTVKVEEILHFCIEQGLFELQDNGRITCLKLLAHLDNTMSNNQEIKNILNNFKQFQETSSNLKQIRLDKIRLDKNKDNISTKKKKKTITIPPQLSEIESYLKDKNIANFTADKFYDYYQSKNWFVGRNKMTDWRAAIRTWVSNSNEIKNNEPKQKTVAEIAKERGIEI